MESTASQLWLIQKLLSMLHEDRKSTAELRRIFPTKESASKAIAKLKEIQGREADRINALPVGLRLSARSQMSAEDRKEVFNK